MSIFASVIGVTRSIACHVGHAIIRDLTGYYVCQDNVHKLHDSDIENDQALNDVVEPDNLCLDVDDNLDEIHSNEDNCMAQTVGDDVTYSGSLIEHKCELDEIENNPNLSEITLEQNYENNLNVIEKESNHLSYVDKDFNQIHLNVREKQSFEDVSDNVINGGQSIVNGQTVDVNITLNVEEKNNSQADGDSIRSDVTGTTQKYDLYRKYSDDLDGLDEKNICGGIQTNTDLQANDNSGTSRDCQLSICNFNTSQKQKCYTSTISKEPNHNMKSHKDKLIKKKISKYISNSVVSHISNPIFNEPLQSLLTDKVPEYSGKELVTSDKMTSLTTTDELKAALLEGGLPDEFNGITKNLLESLRASKDDAVSVCSDVSWDSWFSFNKPYVSTVRPESCIVSTDTLPVETCDAAGQDEAKCECVKSNCCLQIVDSDEDIEENLLSIQQLDTVETGSEGDWLYKVRPRNSLMQSMNMAKSGEKIMNICMEQESDEVLCSESSSEELAKAFYVKQWLDSSKRHFNFPNSTLLACGDSA